MDRGWSLKQLHRLIVTRPPTGSRRSVTPELLARDPYNRLLARGPRFRVEAEIVRDIALAASGLLNPKIGGPSVYPPAPDVPVPAAGQLRPEDLERSDGHGPLSPRALHVPLPLGAVSRCCRPSTRPTATSSCVRRARSNTPLQALTTLNEPLFVECAQALARGRCEGGGTTDAERRRRTPSAACLARPPDADGAERCCSSCCTTADQRFADGRAEPVGAGRRRPGASRRSCPPASRRQQLAAWTVVSRVLLNLDETITKE